MDSLANWASIGALSAGMASLGNLDRNLDFASCSNTGLNPVKPPNLECEGRLSELNGMALSSDWMKLMGLSSGGPNGEGDRAGLTTMASSDEEFGHWRPVYDEKTRPTFSVTGTEIWQAQKTGSVPTEKTTEWNLTDATKTSAAAVTAMESVKCLLRDEETGSEKNQDPREGIWCGSSDVHSNSSGSMLDIGSSGASNVDSNTGWGTTPICQEKPWDMHHDRSVLETGAALTGRQDIQKPRDPSQDCGLELWRNSLMAGEPVGGMMNQKSRGFDGRSLELFAKSDASDDVALQLELQKFALMENHSPDGLMSRSRRGSSVSSIDGISLSSLGGRVDRRDPGVEPNCETMSWVDMQKKAPSQRDEWNHGNAGLQLYTGLQSPSGWSNLSGSEKTPPVVDNGTAVWSKTSSQEKVADDTLAWVKMLRSQSYPAPPSVFDIDMSLPPPPLNAPPVLPLGVVTSAPPGLSLPPMLSNLQPSSNLTARKLSSPLSYMAGQGGLVSPSADILEKPWPYLQHLQQQPVERQRPWTGNQWINSDQWNNMQRKHQCEATRQQSLGLHNDALNTGSLNSDHFRGGLNLYPMQYKPTGTVHNKAPQTRSKLIQQLVSMGFKKEDAQNALITYNMDLKKALAELIAKRSMVAPSPMFDPRLNSYGGGGQLAQNTDNVKDVLRSSYGVLPGHGMGVGGSGLSDAPLDLNKLIHSSMGWDALMQSSSSPLQMLQSGRNPLATGPMPPPLLHSSHQLPPTMHPTARGQEACAGLSQDNLRQLSDLALRLKLAESGCNPDAELLQLFARTLSVSNSFVPSRDSTSAIYSHGNGLPVGLKLPDHLGSTIQSGLFPSPTLASGPGRSASVEPKTVPAQKGLEGFDLPPSLIGRQFSLNLESSTNQDEAPGLNRSDASSSLQSLPADVKLSQVDLQKLPPKLEIKEFIPGVPWKGAQESGDQMPAVPAVATAFKDATTTDWPPKAKEMAAQEDSVKKCLPSKWLELKNISDQMDDVTLHGLCTSHGQVKVFTRQEADGSLLVSYVNLDDAINAKAALDQYELNGVPITAEFIKDWTDTGASATTNESDSLGFMTPDGLWIPPDADGEPAYYGRADEWCEGYDEEAQPDERWNGETAFDPVTSTACEDPSSQEQ